MIKSPHNYVDSSGILFEFFPILITHYWRGFDGELHISLQFTGFCDICRVMEPRPECSQYRMLCYHSNESSHECEALKNERFKRLLLNFSHKLRDATLSFDFTYFIIYKCTSIFCLATCLYDGEIVEFEFQMHTYKQK